MITSMGNRVRVVIGAVVAALVIVNLVVLLWMGPEVITIDEVEKEQPPKDWEEEHEDPTEPIIIHGFKSDPPENEEK